MAKYGPKPKARDLNPEDTAPWNCMRCDRSLPVSAYHAHPSGSYGYVKKCRECTNTEHREAASRRGRDYARNQKLLRNYGITLIELRDRLNQQGGGCAICESPAHMGKFWHVDHDHACCPEAGKSCGKCIRGILCHPCNVALGIFADSTKALRAAADYLEASRG